MNLSLRVLAIICLSLFSFSCSTDSVDEFETVNEVVVIPDAKIIEVEAMEFINAHRISIGLNALQYNDQVKGQAFSHTNYMVENDDISHHNFFQRKNYLESNIGAVKVSENVAYGFTNAEALVNAWVNSEGHKANIEGDYTHFELSAEQNASGKWYYTNIFIKQ